MEKGVKWKIRFNETIQPTMPDAIPAILIDVVRYLTDARQTRAINHDSERELYWTVLPTVMLFFIAAPSITLLYFADKIPTEDAPIFNYKIIGHQWYWSYDYFGIIYGDVAIANPGGDLGGFEHQFDSYMLSEDEVIENFGFRLLEVDNPLILPADSNIHFLITSADVLHAWSVPSLGVKIDAVPGRINHICIAAKRPGTFYGQCSEICGVNHGFMPIKLQVFEVEGNISAHLLSFGEDLKAPHQFIL